MKKKLKFISTRNWEVY